MDKEKILESLDIMYQCKDGNDKNYNVLKEFINEHYKLIDMLKSMSVYDTITARDILSKSITEEVQILLDEKNKLKKEINQLRRKLSMTEKYRDKTKI